MEAEEKIAKEFHESYERLAPSFNYKPRKATSVPWDQVPRNNRELMVAVVREVMIPKLRRLQLDIAYTGICPECGEELKVLNHCGIDSRGTPQEATEFRCENCGWIEVD